MILHNSRWCCWICADDGPKLFLNIEDYLYYNSGHKINQKFHDIMAFMR